MLMISLTNIIADSHTSLNNNYVTRNVYGLRKTLILARKNETYVNNTMKTKRIATEIWQIHLHKSYLNQLFHKICKMAGEQQTQN